MRILQTESLFSMLVLLQKSWWMPCFVCMIGVDTWLLLGVTTTANQQVRLCRIFTFWRWIRLIGSSTWCRIAGFVPFTDNLFMKRENLAVSSQYPPCPFMESFPLPAWISCSPPDALAYRKLYWTSLVPLFPFSFLSSVVDLNDHCRPFRQTTMAPARWAHSAGAAESISLFFTAR